MNQSQALNLQKRKLNNKREIEIKEIKDLKQKNKKSERSRSSESQTETKENDQDNQAFYSSLLLLDLIYCADIILQFISAYEDRKYQIQDNPKKIAKHYIKSWFLIDMASIIPIKYLYFNNA